MGALIALTLFVGFIVFVVFYCFKKIKYINKQISDFEKYEFENRTPEGVVSFRNYEESRSHNTEKNRLKYRKYAIYFLLIIICLALMQSGGVLLLLLGGAIGSFL